MLARRDHSCRELAGKLRSKGYQQVQIDAAVSECLRLNYLNDEKFCGVYTKHLRRKGYGRMRIVHMLKAKGISENRIEDAVNRHCNETAQIEDCKIALAKKLRAEQRTQSETVSKIKLYRFLSNRGFANEIIRQVIQGEFEGYQD